MGIETKILSGAIASTALTISALVLSMPPTVQAAPNSENVSEIAHTIADQLEDIFASGASAFIDGHEYQLRNRNGAVLFLNEYDQLALSDNCLVPGSVWHVLKDGNQLSFQLDDDGRFLSVNKMSAVLPSPLGLCLAEDGDSTGTRRWMCVDSATGITLIPKTFRCLAVNGIEPELTGASEVLADNGGLVPYDIMEMRARLQALPKTDFTGLPEELSIECPDGFVACSEGAVILSPSKGSRSATWQPVTDEDGFVSFENLASGGWLSLRNDYWKDQSLVLCDDRADLLSKWIVSQGEDGSFSLSSAVWENLNLSWDGTMLRAAAEGNDEQSWLLAENSSYLRQEEGQLRMAAIAQAEYESGPHKGGEKYWSLFSSKYEAWCSEFGGWCLHEAGLELGKTMPKKVSGAGQLYKFYQEHPEYGSVRSAAGSARPQTGDICLYNDGNGKPAHTNVCVEVRDDCFYAVSGNCGDRVKRVHKNFGFSGYYITINWERALEDSR